MRLEAATASYLAAMRQASAVTSEFGRNIAGVGDLSDKHLQRVSRGALLMSGGLAVGLGLSAKAAVDWESAWAGVTKTVDGSAAQMADLQAGLRDMASELPATHAEIAGVAEAAGQLGIQTASIEAFSRVMLDLGETTNMTAEEAATSMARLANITQMPQTEFDRLGSTVVELGNNLATTEAEIVQMGLRIAGAGNQIGLAESDILAFAGALSSVGIEAEAGGSAISRVMIDIANEVETGGDRLATFADVAGMSASEFSSAFREDASGAIVAFIEGLGNMEAQGGSTLGVLGDLEITEIRMRDALLRASGAGDLLRESLEMGAEAWEDNNALQTEAEQRYKTTAAQMEMLRNRVVDLGIDAGTTLLPALNGVVGGLGSMVDGLAALPGPAKTAATGLAGISTAGLGIIGIVGTVGPKFVEFRNGLLEMGTASQFVGRNLGRITGALAGVGAAIAVGTYIYGEATRASREYDDQVKELASSLQTVADGQASVNDVLSGFLTDKIAGDDLDTLRAFGVTFDDLTASIESGGDVLDPFRAKVRELGIDLDGVDLGKLDDGANPAALNDLADALGISAGQLKNFIDAIEDYDDAAQDAARTELQSIASTDDLSAARVRAVQVMAALAGEGDNYAWQLAQLEGRNEAAAPAADGFTDAMEDQETAAERLQDALDALSDAFDALIGVNLSVEEANLRVHEAFAELPGILAENGTSLDALTEAGRANRGALADMVGGINDHVQALIEQGASTDDVNFYLSAQREQLAGVMRQAGFTEEQIDGYIATLGLTPENIATIVELHGVTQAESSLNSLTRTREARINVRTVQIGAQAGGARTPGLQLASGGAVPQYLAMGGPSWTPRGTDTVPAMLTPGEFVVRKQAVDAVGVGYLDALNTYGGYQAPMSGAGGGSMDYARLAVAMAKVAGPTFQMQPTLVVRDAADAADEMVAGFERIRHAHI